MDSLIVTQNIISRQYAVSNKLKHYFTGKPCKYGHISIRYVSTNKCFDCNKRDAEKWKKENPEIIKISRKKTKEKQGKDRLAAWKKQWDERNSEHKRKYKEEWYNKNKQHCVEYSKKYKIENRDVAIRAESKRRVLKSLSTTESFTKNDVLLLLEKQKSKCVYCKEKLTKYHIDHIIPIKLGGDNSKYNIQLLCVSCNCRKNAKHPIKFAQENGMLL